jgi:murein DD-endopeptidase MepM/ murein hydrolase activator NlpD
MKRRAGSVADLGNILTEWANAWFHERQVIIRGHDKLSVIHITQKQQLTVVGLFTAALLWTTLSPLAFLFTWHSEAHASNTARKLSHELASTQATLNATAAQNSALAEAASEAQAKSRAIVNAADAKVQALDAQTQAAIGQVQNIIHATGLTAGHTAPPAPKPASADHTELLQSDLSRLDNLNAYLSHIPLGQPVPSMAISSPFGMRPDPWTGAPEFHVGIDLRGPIGTPISATAPGVVTYAGWETGYGQLVVIDHGYGLSTRYSHLDKILVHVGEKVTLHETVGLMGNTGWSTGPHLLYETRIDGAPQNPLNFLKVREYDVQD